MASNINVESIKGTRDFPPELMRERNWLFGIWKDVARKYSFDEYDAPILEEESLYIRKAGEEISEQIYNFETKEGMRVSLRPEMTPSLARLIMQKGKAMVYPARWFAIPQCWRFETIQKGRKREHFQWNMDVIGSKSVSAEAELIAAAVDFFKAVQLTSKDVVIRISSRKVLQNLLEKEGITGNKLTQTFMIIDKLDKYEEAEILKFLAEVEVGAELGKKLIDMLKKGTRDSFRELVGEKAEGMVEIDTLFSMLDAYGISDWVQFFPAIVRGLVYYTGVVFEGFDRKGGRAIMGGGRYDELLTKLGNPFPVPCVGFGFGDCVIMDVLKDRKKKPELKPTVQDVVFPFDASPEMRSAAIQVACILRERRGRQVSLLLDKSRVKQCFAYADHIQAERAVFVAPDEWAKGCVRVKSLREGAGKAEEKETNNGEEITLDQL